MTDELVMGRRNSLRETVLMAAITGGVLPGLGLLIIPSMIADGDLLWGGVAWVAFWTMPAFVVRWLQREHRIVGDELVSTYHRRTETRSLADVVEVRPLRWYLPGARIVFDDGRAIWAGGATARRFLAAVLARARPGADQLPTGEWLRPRRIVWLIIGFAALLGDRA